jgi:UDP-glucose 4-epimerase
MEIKSENKVVILGKKSFIGRAANQLLKESNYETLILGRDDIDLTQSDASVKLRKFLKPGDIVIGAAAIAPCKDLQMFEANLRIVDTICKAVASSEIDLFLNISSDAVYPDLVKPINENCTISPTSLHGAMHLSREIAINSIRGFGVCHLRPTLVYGPGDTHNGYGPNLFVSKATSKQNIPVFGKGEERRDHIFISDLAQIILRIIRMKYSGTLNAVTGTLHSFKDIAETVIDLTEQSISIEYLNRSQPIPHNGYREFDNSKLVELFPDLVFTSLRSGIIASMKNN